MTKKLKIGGIGPGTGRIYLRGLDQKVYEYFKRWCGENDISMSAAIEQLMLDIVAAPEFVDHKVLDRMHENEGRRRAKQGRWTSNKSYTTMGSTTAIVDTIIVVLVGFSLIAPTARPDGSTTVSATISRAKASTAGRVAGIRPRKRCRYY